MPKARPKRSWHALLAPAEDFGAVVDPARPTAVKERFVAGGQQLLRADYELSRPVAAEESRIASSPKSRKNGMRWPHAPMPSIAIGLRQGRADRPGPPPGRRLPARPAGARHVPVIVDPKGSDYGRYRGAGIVTPNLKELTEAAGGPVKGDDGVAEAARLVMAKSGIAAMVATRGRDGLSVVRADAEPVHIGAQAREVFDVSGAGDTVVATLALALATGADLATAASLANFAAAVVVGKVGTAVVTPDELRHVADDAGQGGGKAMALPVLLDQVERWRRRGLRVAFTNGCFDLLHPGHLSLLRQSRAAADRLVVGLNSDASVRRLKGRGPAGIERNVAGDGAGRGHRCRCGGGFR